MDEATWQESTSWGPRLRPLIYARCVWIARALLLSAFGYLEDEMDRVPWRKVD